MQFTCDGIVRMAFGFANPNHAAAAICALMPFCWSWRRCKWLGWSASGVLCVMLAMTFSRTGFVVLALEFASWCRVACLNGRDVSGDDFRSDLACGPLLRRCLFAAAALSAGAAALWWMRSRLVLDGAIMNRPRIWLAGLNLLAANPSGVGFGNSGSLASAFLLPEGVAVRTLVNSHLTLAAEAGWSVGGAWLAFILAAMFAPGKLTRTRISFAGLVVSAFAASVFDWHVLLGFSSCSDHDLVNFILSWVLFASFAAMGVALIAQWRLVSVRRTIISLFAWVLAGMSVCGASMSVLRRSDTPRITDGFVEFGTGGPVACHDTEWTLRQIRDALPDGALVRIDSGTDMPHEAVSPAREVWLFGDAAESFGKFPDSRVVVVSPPPYCEFGTNVTRIIVGGCDEAPDDPRVERL